MEQPVRASGAVDVMRLIGLRDPAVVATYTVETEFALLAACLRDPVILDETAAFVAPEHFLEPVCATIWMALINARIDCSVVDDDRLHQALIGLSEDEADRIVDRLRQPLVKPKRPVKFAREVARLARERAA